MNDNNTNTVIGKVLLIYTGGTIGMGRNAETGALEPLNFNHLIERMPEFEYLQTGIEVYQFAPPIDSSNMNPRHWAQLVRIIADRYDRYDGFVILHGTDTMAYTASAISYMLENLTKPVILTGSQLPVGQLRTDGKENLVTSIEIASMHDERGHALVPEVCIYFSGKLLRGNRSTKQTADGLTAFDSFNYPHLCDAGVNFDFNTHYIMQPNWDKPMIPHYAMNSNVMVVSFFPGIEEDILRSVLAAKNLRGIIIRSYGSGNAPQSPWLMRVLKEVSERGIVVVNISQCIAGFVEMGRYDAGYHLQAVGVVSGHDSTVEASVTKLMYLLGKYNDYHVVRNLMSRCLAGEFTIPRQNGNKDTV